MHQVWLLLATLGISATSLGQYSGNRYLGSAIDKTWQRHGGGFLNQESYAHDASKERKISTTIGSFGTPLTPHLGGKYDVPEYSSIYIPEVTLAGGAEGFLGVNHEPLRAIEGSVYDPMYINKYGKNYDRDVLIGLARDDDKVLYKGYNEHLPYEVLYREHPINKDRVSIVTQVHPPEQEDYLVEKFRKDPFGKDHYTVVGHNPYGEHDKILYKGYTDRLPHDVLYRENPIDKDRVSIVTHVHPSIQEEYLVEKFRKDPFGKDHYTAVEHNPYGDHDKILYKGYTDRLPHDVLYRENPIDKERVSIVTHVHPSVQEEYLVEKFRKDPFGKDQYTVRKHNPRGDDVVVDTIYKDLPKSEHIEVKTQENIFKDAYTPHEEFHGKDHLIVKTEEKVFRDKLDPTMDRFYVDKIHKNIPVRDHIVHETVYKDLKHPGTKLLEKEHTLLGSPNKYYKDEYMPQEHIFLDKLYVDPYGRDSVALTHEKAYKDVHDSPDYDGHHHISVKTEEVYQPKLRGYGKDHLTVKTEEKIYKDIPNSGPEKVTVENIYRTHAIEKPDFYDEPYFRYEKEYSDEEIGFEHYDEKIFEGKHLYKVNEKQVKVDLPIEERLSTFRTRPTHRRPWPRREKPCDLMSEYQDSDEC